jgi:hypothetical protein
MVAKTQSQYRDVIAGCKELFLQKTRDYGTAWRVLRLPSITDQIFIKAQRIRSIQEKGTQKIGDTVNEELVGIVNYCFIALIQIKLAGHGASQMQVDEVMQRYDEALEETMQLLDNKNHDYGEAWRSMRVSSIVDIILMKLMRVKQIENNQGKTFVSEGVKANYQDMINYAIFALILLGEERP